LRPFITQTGIQGRFAISFDENNKFQTMRQIG